MSETRWRLTPLDKSKLVYFGMDITNGNQAALFVLWNEQPLDHLKASDEDVSLQEAIIQISKYPYWSDKNEAEVDGMIYRIVPWTNEFDTALVKLIDRLIHIRMTNAQSVSLRLQLEMPL